MAELEESRRKLVNLKVQNVACGTHIPILSPVNGVHSFEKSTDRSRGMRELKVSLEEAKVLWILSCLSMPPRNASMICFCISNT